MTLKSFAFFVLASIVLIGCDSEKSERRLPRHSGESGEILIVMNEGLWLSNPGDSLRNVLEQSYSQLPQAEPSFSLLQFSSGEMNDLLRQHRNIIKIIIGADSGGKTGITLARNKWSNGQLVFTLKAEDEEAFNRVLNTELEQVVSMLDQAEVERYQSKYKRVNDQAIEDKIERDFNIQMLIPAECEIAESSKDFMWVKRERVKYIGNTGHDITQGFFVFRYPYSSDSLLDENAILAKRDEMLKKYVPGPNKGTYMATEYRFPPSSDLSTVNGKYAVETRGLWRTENYFMGGPFMQLTTTSADDQYVVCVSGFVFAPKFKKREYIREIDAILQSVSPLAKAKS